MSSMDHFLKLSVNTEESRKLEKHIKHCTKKKNPNNYKIKSVSTKNKQVNIKIPAKQYNSKPLLI